jgi:DNA-binding MarR family transcriptional regulator
MPNAHIAEPGGARDRRDVEEIRLALVELRRLFQRKELVELWAAAFGRTSKLSYAEIRLLDAVDACRRGGAGGATVGDVSRALGVDPSRASREVARAVGKRLLARRAAQGDARKVELVITDRGGALLKKGSHLTRARIALALHGWSGAERRRFSSSFTRFVTALLSSKTKRRGQKKS